MESSVNVKKLDNLGKNSKSLKGSEKFSYTKRKINKICMSLSYDNAEYNPKETLELISSFFDSTDNMGRILYSEISSCVFSMSEKERGIFGTNIETLLLEVLEDNHSNCSEKSEDIRKFIIKLYDHFQLALYQIENTDKQHEKSIEKTRKELQKEVKGMEKEYISILGIFSSVVLAFVGGLTFSTSVLNNVDNVSIYRLVAIALIIGFVFINMIGGLMDFVKNINNLSKRPWWFVIIPNVVILAGIIFIIIAYKLRLFG